MQIRTNGFVRPGVPVACDVTHSAYGRRHEHLVLAFEEALVQGLAVGLGISVHAAHAQQQTPPFSRVFERCPVLVGRDPEVANLVLPDDRVSRVHASFDIRDRWICVRDSGSTNGTFVGGQRIPSDRWVAAGGLNVVCEIRIGEWILKVSTCDVRASVPPDGADFLRSMPPEPPHNQTLPAGAVRPDLSGAAARRRVGETTVVAESSSMRVTRAWALLVAARNELVVTLADVIEATPAAQRPQVVREVLDMCATIEREPGVRALLERHGGAPLPHTLESGAALALQELARWYVNDQPPLATATEGFAFARKLKTGIDELLLGLVPMFAGLDRFEQQMALRPQKDTGLHADLPKSSRLPRVPRNAARLLFNWRDPTDAAVRAVRTDLVDLTMHQVAVLNGVMRGVKQLLAELAPGTIEIAWRRRLEKRGLFGRLLGSLRGARERWTLYSERHGDLADEENERFRVIFGPEFVAEYKQSGQTVVQGRTSPLAQPMAAPAAPGTWSAPPPRPPHPQNRN